MAEQYFSAEPASKDVRRTLNVTLRGHEADRSGVERRVLRLARGPRYVGIAEACARAAAYRRFSGFGLRLGPYRPDIGV